MGEQSTALALPAAPREPIPLAVRARVSERADQSPYAVYLARLAPGSRPAMRNALRTIARELGSTPVELPWEDLRYQHTQAIRSRLLARYAHSTTNKMLAALRGVLLEAKRLGLMSVEDYDRAVDLPSVRGTRVQPGRALSPEEIGLLFGAVDRLAASGARDAAVLAVMYGAGLRRAEVPELNLEDFSAEESSLRVRGKGNKERLVYLDDGAKRALEGWIEKRGSEPGPLVLPIDKWGHIHKRRMSDSTIHPLLERIAHRAGVKEFSPHDLRRTFITTLLDNNVDIRTAQKLAGHEDVNTTARYDRRGEQAKKDAVKVLHVPT